jgi:diacylglycerol kinase (ATP)
MLANNASLGGGMLIVPHAELTDGLLDVLIVHPLSRAGLLAVFPKVFAGEHTNHPAVEFLRGRRISIEADDIVAYGDGERLGPLPIEVEIVPGAISVFA